MDYRQQRNYENINKTTFRTWGKYDIPVIAKTVIQKDELKKAALISFNNALSSAASEEIGVHFFIDDYQFERIWKAPSKYINVLSKFSFMLAPDFSIYANFPVSIQIYNHYRKHWCASYFQQHGITVIPTIAWGDSASYEWCFDGEPSQSTVAVSSVGALTNLKSTELFINGYKEMQRRLNPGAVLFYGTVPGGVNKSNVIEIPPFYSKFSKGDK